MSESVESFKPAPMSAGYRVLTGVYLTGFGLVALFVLAVTELWPQHLIYAVLALGVASVPGANVLGHLRPLRIEIHPRHMRFVHPFKKWNLELSAITGVRMANWEEIGRPRRLWGSRGIFGFFALFRTGDGQWYRAMVTRPDGIVMLTRRQRPPLLFTPDDPERFRRTIEEVLRSRQVGTA
ncbi:MAG: PH domain-containing protein [Phycisphaerae bacterium]